jgi:2-keto-4-pentenoate hydratase/2-oxohepta-3-ene-1,7-dioic acid hydratase in catechol pathway
MFSSRVVLSASLCVLLTAAAAQAQSGVTRYVRFQAANQTALGILEGNTIHEISGDLFGQHRRTGRTVPLERAKLLAPVQPSKAIAIGLNYRSHLGDRPVAAYPGVFAKYPTSIVGPDDDIVRPADSKNLHYEGELVIVIGKRAKDVPAAAALQYVFGVTAGNDVSERDWQRDDLQWWRAKAADTFGPIGPTIARGLNYNDLMVTTRLNGEVRQQERTKDLIFNIETIVSYVSRYVTLMPGDIIFTGTPQTTRAMQPGDVVEIEVEGVGKLRNKVVDGTKPVR